MSSDGQRFPVVVFIEGCGTFDSAQHHFDAMFRHGAEALAIALRIKDWRDADRIVEAVLRLNDPPTPLPEG